MKKIILLLLVFIDIEYSWSQVITEELPFDFNIAYCVGEQEATAWIGEGVVVMIEGESPTDRDSVVMDQVVKIFEEVLAKFEELTGLDNLPIRSVFDDKPVIEVVQDNCGAGGLAAHGVLGMSTGMPLFEQFYGLVEEGIIAIPQVFLYELNRNFWLAGNSGFNGKFDWAMNDEPQNYGWWTVGMNNAMAYIVPKELDIQMHYFGTTGLEFWKEGMVGDFMPYLNDNQYDFDYGWRQSLMPWRPVQSINNLMSGFILYSYENFGGEEWIKGFYQHIQSAEIPNRSDVFAYQECRDNIYKIWSLAAEEDLLSFFEDSLRWTITAEAQQFVLEQFSLTSTEIPLENSSISVYPNPTIDFIQIESPFPQSIQIELINSIGQVLYSGKIKAKLTLSTSNLSQGIYWIKSEKVLIPIIKN